MARKFFQSEIPVAAMPPAVWTPVMKPLSEMRVALVTGAGVHVRNDTPFELTTDSSFRIIPGDCDTDLLTVTHGGYDNGDALIDCNSMLPLDRLRELAAEGLIGSVAPRHIGFMGGGGDLPRLESETGPAIAAVFAEDRVDAAVFTAGWGTCHRSTAIVERVVEGSGIPTIIISALPTISIRSGAPRGIAPVVPIGANAGAPKDKRMQREILRQALLHLALITEPGQHVPLAIGYS